eukprot:5015627-Lingulodinium_polyedra.AAC.1
MAFSPSSWPSLSPCWSSGVALLTMPAQISSVPVARTISIADVPCLTARRNATSRLRPYTTSM